MTTADIQIERKRDEPGAAHLSVSVPLERVQRAEQEAANTLRRRAKLPGFRPGRAPLSIVRRQFREAIRETVVRGLVKESWDTAVEREDIKPIAEPKIANFKFEPGAPVTFDIEVEVKPEVSIQRLGGFKLPRTVQPVTDEMIAAQLEQLRDQRAPWSPLEAGMPQAGDLVNITLGVIDDGEARNPQRFDIVLGEGRALPDIERAIQGMELQQTADVQVTYQDDHADEAKRGTTQAVRVTLNEAKRKTLPSLDDDFAREIGDFEDLDALRTALADDLRAEAEREADADVRRDLLRQIAEANNVPVPRAFVERTLVGMAQAYGIHQDQWETFQKELRPAAEEQVRRELIIEWVADEHSLRATEAELDERIAQIAERRKATPADVYASLEKAKRLRELERGITEQKIFAHLLEQSTVEDK